MSLLPCWLSTNTVFVGKGKTLEECGWYWGDIKRYIIAGYKVLTTV